MKQYWDVPLNAPRRSARLTQSSNGRTVTRSRPYAPSLRCSARRVPFGWIGFQLRRGIDVEARCRGHQDFSIGYDSAESELAYARVVAEHFHTDHHELQLTSGRFRDILPKIVWHMDEPVGDTASIPLYYLSEFARQNVTVALSGEGSDEIFGGYRSIGACWRLSG